MAAEIAEDGGTCHTVTLDIRDEDAVREAVERVVAQHGQVAGLVNNAGGS